MNIIKQSDEISEINNISPKIIESRDIESVNGETCWSHLLRSIAIRPRTYCRIKAMRSAQLPKMVDVVEAAVDQLWNSSFGVSNDAYSKIPWSFIRSQEVITIILNIYFKIDLSILALIVLFIM